MTEILSLPFMQRALLAALLVGLTAPSVGIYLVQRRQALMGDGIGHVALTGVAIGVLLGTAPVLTAVVVAAAGAVAIELVRERGRTSGDVALALLFYGGIAGGVLILSMAGGGSTQLVSYLFGSLTTVSSSDLAVMALLAALVLAVTLGLGRHLFAVCQDEEFARVTGLPVRVLNLLLAVTAAVTVTVAMRVVGVLLVSALMVVPVATAQQVTRGFRSTAVAAMGLGVGYALAGVVGSYYADSPSGASIVVLAIGGFGVAAVVTALRGVRARGTPAPAAEDDLAISPGHAS
ncbi:MAG: metal ABC transporter permease [Actinomycetes bacterium]